MSLRMHMTQGRCARALLAAALALLTTAVPFLLPLPSEVHVSPAVGAYLGLVLTGTAAGLLSGAMGMGGGVVVVPALCALLPHLGVEDPAVVHTAVATSLLAMVPTAALSALLQHGRGALALIWIRRMALPMLLGAALGAIAAAQAGGTVLVAVFAVQSLLYGWSLVRPGTHRPCHRVLGQILRSAIRLPAAVAGLLIAGFSSCAGMGGGTLMVPYLVGRGVPLLHAAATSSALNLSISLAGVAAFVALSAGADSGAGFSVRWDGATCIAAASLIAVPCGVRWAHRLPVQQFRRILGWLTLACAGVLCARAWI